MVSKKDRIWVLYPEYFDALRSRSEGRRVKREYAFKKVSTKEIFDAASGLNLGPVMEENHHPSDWYRQRSRVLVRKEFSKEDTIRAVARKIRENKERTVREAAGDRGKDTKKARSAVFRDGKKHRGKGHR